MNAKERAEQIRERWADPREDWDLCAQYIESHLEEYRREGMEATRQACALRAADYLLGTPCHALGGASVQFVLATPLPGEGEPT